MDIQIRESKKYRIPYWALYFFVYADASGLTDEEESVADAFFEREQLDFSKGCFDWGNPVEPDLYPYNHITNMGDMCVDVDWAWFE